MQHVKCYQGQMVDATASLQPWAFISVSQWATSTVKQTTEHVNSPRPSLITAKIISTSTESACSFMGIVSSE